MDHDTSRLDDHDPQFDDDRIQETEPDTDVEERKPMENMREYAESTMQELLAIYGLAGGELAKSVSRQLPSTFLNPHTGQIQFNSSQNQGQSGHCQQDEQQEYQGKCL